MVPHSSTSFTQLLSASARIGRRRRISDVFMNQQKGSRCLSRTASTLAVSRVHEKVILSSQVLVEKPESAQPTKIVKGLASPNNVYQNRFFSSSSTNNSSKLIPKSANVIVIGGGIIGTSVAYHLSKQGVEDVILLERDKLTSGTTWHAAGLMVTFGSLSSTSTEMRKYSKKLYSEILPSEMDGDKDCCGFKPCGFIELCTTDDHMIYERRVAAFNRMEGIDVHELNPTQIKDLFPLIEIEASEQNNYTPILGGFYVPTDGRVNPYDATMTLAKVAKHKYGAQIYENCAVSGVTTTTNNMMVPTVTGVTLEDGTHIEAKQAVVNCAGMWARQVGTVCGITEGISNQAAEHYYLITESMKDLGVDSNWPVIEDPSRYTYIRPEGDGLMIGLFENPGSSWNTKHVPNDFSFGEIEPNFDRMSPFIERAMSVVPSTLNVGIKKFFCGPESFTPDNNPIVGPSKFYQNYFVAAGLNSIGILTGGGIGRLVSDWICNIGISPTHTDVTGIHINRINKNQSNNPNYRNDRVGESLGNTYALHYPDYSPKTCRNIKKSPFHDRLYNEQNAYFRDVSGWESPSWYAPSPDVLQKPAASTFGREHWFQYWKEEHDACRNNVALFDMSFMSKFLVQGKDAGRFLNLLSTANVDGNSNTITYTQWLNEFGYLEADLTVTKIDEEIFLVVATDTMHGHVEAHMKKRLRCDQFVTITDVTGAYAQLNIQGPKSRNLLQSLITSEDMSNESFVFRHMKDIDIGYGRALCTRITYVGELGYELFIPVEFATHVYDEIVAQGKTYNLRHAGLRALGSLRMEKGYRDYGHDIDNTDTILEAGLGFTCDFDKPNNFIGMDHVIKQKKQRKMNGGLKRRLVQVLLKDSEPLLHHGEILWRTNKNDGTKERVGDVRSASYGHTLGGAVGLVMISSSSNKQQTITKDFVDNSVWEVETPMGIYPCEISITKPLYDPKNSKIKM